MINVRNNLYSFTRNNVYKGALTPAKRQGGGGANIRVFVFYLINFFWNRVFLQSVNTNTRTFAQPPKYCSASASTMGGNYNDLSTSSWTIVFCCIFTDNCFLWTMLIFHFFYLCLYRIYFFWLSSDSRLTTQVSPF